MRSSTCMDTSMPKLVRSENELMCLREGVETSIVVSMPMWSSCCFAKIKRISMLLASEIKHPIRCLDPVRDCWLTLGIKGVLRNL